MNFTPKFEVKSPENAQKGYEPVTNYMARDLITFKPDDEIGTVIAVLNEKQISGAPVLNDRKELVGIISEQDCLKVVIDSVYHNQPVSKHFVKDYMHTDLITISENADVVDVANMFLKHRFRRFPVVKDGKLLGQVSKRDILRAALKIKFTTW
ncbi:MAG: CBS domain-containing protein [Cyclobacteriaceae bacterium]|nr:CBS domain-containing protein [Cyclobacteriaceae bacterium]